MAQTTSYYFTDNEIDELTGHYEFSEKRILKISLEDDVLYGEMTGQSQLILTPAGPYIMYATDIHARIEIRKNKKDEISGLSMTRSSVQEAKKLILKNEKISKKWAKKYIGKYRISNDNLVELGMKDNKWYIKENDVFVDLIPIRQHLFYAPDKVSILAGSTIEMNKIID